MARVSIIITHLNFGPHFARPLLRWGHVKYSQSEAFPRLAKPASERFVKYVIEAMVDREKLWFEQFCEVDLAHTVMLAEQGIITKEQAAAILGTIKEIQQLGPTKFPTSPTLGSLLLQIEKFMSNKIGKDVAARMSHGKEQKRPKPNCSPLLCSR